MIRTARAPRVTAVFLSAALALSGWACAKHPYYEPMTLGNPNDASNPYMIRGKPAVVGGVALSNGATSANVQFVLKKVTAADNMEGAEIAHVVGTDSDLTQVVKTITGVGGTVADLMVGTAALKTAQAVSEGKLRDVGGSSTSIQTAPTNMVVSSNKQSQGQSQEANATASPTNTLQGAISGTVSGTNTSSNKNTVSPSITGASSTAVSLSKGGDAANINNIDASPTVTVGTKVNTTSLSSPAP